MGSLVEVFGDRPRVRLLEAILELAPVEFTATDLAEEAGLSKSSAYRVVPDLEEDGVLVVTSEVRPTGYRVNDDKPLIELLHYFDTALDAVLGPEPEGGAQREAVDAFRHTVLEGMYSRREIVRGQTSKQPGQSITFREGGIQQFHQVETGTIDTMGA